MISTSVISAQLVDEIHQLALNRTKTVFPLFKQIHQLLQYRRKKTQVYAWTVTALKRQIQRRLCEDRFLSERHETQYEILAKRRRQLDEEIAKYTQQIRESEGPLQAAQEYAQQRQAKHQRRQYQYQRYRKIPIIGSTFKRKNLRALKKSQQADTTLAAQKVGLSRIEEKRLAAVRQQHQERQEQAQIVHDIREIHARIHTNEALEKQWMDGLTYWTDKMEPLCLLVDQKTTALQHMLRTTTSPESEFIAVLNGFRYACLAYAHTETYGEHHWCLDNVDFVCAKCSQTISHDTPRPDKTRPADLLCTSCYKGSRTAMIIKKKLGFTTPPPPILSPSSSTSTLLATPPPYYTLKT